MNRTPVADWQQLSALYELADTLDPASLDHWLAQLADQAHPLLGQLREMLGARSKIEGLGFLGTLPKIRLEPEPRSVEWQAGSRLGVYRLLRRLGSGGMAEVWLAERDDGVFERQVAIKLLFRNERSSERDSFARRFERERRILASLDHPHIAGLHDAGVTREGQPWLALEYVEGQVLTAWCDARQLGIEARVRLFRQVLLAVQHAHANLVIHRDLKPGNILVTAQGEVRLLDFGIAKLLEPEGGASAETELTRLAGRPMTPRYASPEQLQGQPLTTACDVYALGVVLYELLCGESPYELKLESAAQLEQAILEDQPRMPSRRAWAEAQALVRGCTPVAGRQAVAGDLDAIVLRALAKQPAQRYASVEAMRADLDRWLAGEPVEATAPSTVYRLGKFVRRHVLSVSLGAAAVVALVTVATVAVWMGLQARQDSARAVAARDFMLNIFARAHQEKSRGADITARDLLETGRKDVLDRLEGQPALQAELLQGIAKIQGDMGEYATADSTFVELVRVLGALRRPGDEATARVAHALNAAKMNDFERSARLLRSAEALPGRPPADAALNARIAETAGVLALSAGDTPRARLLLFEGRRAAVAALGAEHLLSFRLGQSLVRVERDRRDFESASALQAELRALAPRVAGIEPGEIAAMDWESVGVLVGAGEFGRALTFLGTALPNCADTLGPQDQNCRFLFLKQQQVRLRLGLVDDARRTMPRLLAMSQDATLPFLQIESLMLASRLTPPHPEAPEPAALTARVQAFGESGPEVAMPPAFKAAALLALSERALHANDARASRRWADRALARLGTGALRGDEARVAAIGRMLIGIGLMQQGRAGEALGWLDLANEGFAATWGAQHPASQLFGMNKVLALAQLQRVPEALALARQAERRLHASLGESAPSYQRVRAVLQALESPASGEPRGGTPEFFS